jgi:hypothetical protein
MMSSLIGDVATVRRIKSVEWGLIDFVAFGWTTSDNMGVVGMTDGGSDPARVELTPMPAINDAVAKVATAISIAFAPRE